MTSHQVCRALEDAGCRLLVSHDFAVIAERAVVGYAHSFRAVIAQENADHSWRVRILRKLPAVRSRAKWAAYDYLPQQDSRGLPLQHLAVRDELELGLFLGGAFSVPFGPEEVAAIQRGEMAVVA